MGSKAVDGPGISASVRCSMPLLWPDRMIEGNHGIFPMTADMDPMTTPFGPLAGFILAESVFTLCVTCQSSPPVGRGPTMSLSSSLQAETATAVKHTLPHADISLLNLAGGSGTAISGPHKRGTGRTKAGAASASEREFHRTSSIRV